MKLNNSIKAQKNKIFYNEIHRLLILKTCYLYMQAMCACKLINFVAIASLHTAFCMIEVV